MTTSVFENKTSSSFRALHLDDDARCGRYFGDISPDNSVVFPRDIVEEMFDEDEDSNYVQQEQTETNARHLLLRETMDSGDEGEVTSIVDILQNLTRAYEKLVEQRKTKKRGRDDK